MRVLIFSLLLLSPLEAQIVTGDGSVVHFFSNLVPGGSNLPPTTRVYRYTAKKGIELEKTLQLDGLVDRLGMLETTADASTVSYWIQHSPLGPNPMCVPQPACYYPITFSGTLEAGDNTTGFSRAVSVNRTGRFAVLYDPSAPPERIDLTTGERFTAPNGVLAAPRQAITADGTLLLASYPGDNTALLSLSSPAGPWPVGTIAFGRGSQFFVVPPYQSTAQISANGATVVWANRNDNTMHTINLASGVDREVPNPAGSIKQYLVTDVGDRVLFLAQQSGKPTQLYVGPSDGSATFMFGGAPEGVYSATFTNDGSTIYALTVTSRLLRIDTGTLEATELLPAVPEISLPTGGALLVAPGSYYRLTGAALNGDVRIGSTALQLLSSTPNELHVQVPFEAAALVDYLHVAGDSPLEQSFPAEVRVLAPRFLTYFDAAIADPQDQQQVAVHGDYSALVTEGNPARLGETVHFYLAGLGAVTPFVATGAASPAHPPATVVRSVRVMSWNGTVHQNMPIFFVGLAPSMTGVYLLSVRLPETLTLPEPPLGQSPPASARAFLQLTEDGTDEQGFVSFWVAVP